MFWSPLHHSKSVSLLNWAKRNLFDLNSDGSEFQIRVTRIKKALVCNGITFMWTEGFYITDTS